MDKAELRRLMRDRVRSLSPEEKGWRSHQACLRLVSCQPFQRASVILLFLSMPDEIDTTEAIQAARHRGARVAVPKVDWDLHSMTAVEIPAEGAALTVSRSGLRNPVEGTAIDPAGIDLVVAPGLGFDRRGHRLGRGAGFYDRFLVGPAANATRCGFCFREQVVESIPVTEADVPVHWLVTDEEAICVS
jgi:5-formyltetrahydrofolate cyclo-ligase